MKKNVRKTIIEASGQAFFENKTRYMGYVMTGEFYNQVSDILKEVHYTHKFNKPKYLDGNNSTSPFILNCYDIIKKVKSYENHGKTTTCGKFSTEKDKSDMLKSLIDISIYANLGIQLWFDKFGEDE